MDSRREHILYSAFMYRKLGISIIPIVAKTKVPAVKPTWLPYQRTIADPATINSWFNNDNNYNIGVVTGEVSNLAIIDIDNDEIYRLLLNKAEWLKEEVTVKTGKGYHIWLSFFEYPRTLTFRINGVTCHIKSNGGYCVAPPSIHESGREYKFVKSRPEQRSLVDINEIKNLIKSCGGQFSAEILNDRPANWASSLFREIKEGERNDSAARLCGLLIKKHPFNPDLIRFFMESWNKEFCKPPLSEKELSRLVESEMARYLPKEREFFKSQTRNSTTVQEE